MMKRMIALDTWARAPRWRQFWEDDCEIFLSDDVDVTALFSRCAETETSFHLAVLFTVAQVVNGREEFRMTAVDAPDAPCPLPAVWNEVHPVHNVFHEETETYTSVCTRWDPSFPVFLSRAKEDIGRAKQMPGSDIPAPPNSFETSAVPWRHFAAAGARRGASSLSPLVVWGRAEEREGEGRIKMPLSVQISHAAADGFHLARFLGEFEDGARRLAQEIGEGIR
ncbi:MAG: hypothetical protein IKQ92_05245 [Clostridia bacterium]|nr:hypothetical protein [Clostridia bacterium]